MPNLVKEISIKQSNGDINTRPIGADATNVSVTIDGTAKNLETYLNGVNETIENLDDNYADKEHETAKASVSDLGHVKIGTGLEANVDGVASVKFAASGTAEAGSAVESTDTRLSNDRKNPSALTVKTNGTTRAEYDGAEAKEVDITYDNVGAPPKSHTASAATYGAASEALYGHIKLSKDFKNNAQGQTEVGTIISEADYNALADKTGIYFISDKKKLMKDGQSYGGDVNIATAAAVGLVKPDGRSITIDPDGTIHSKGGGTTFKLAAPTNVSVVAGDEQVTIKWTDPNNSVIEGVTVAEWAKTIVVRKANGAPANAEDGTVVVTETTKNQYSVNGFVDDDTSLVNGTNYYYGIFPGTEDDVFTATSNSNLAVPANANPDAVSEITINSTKNGTKANFACSWTKPNNADKTVIYVKNAANVSDTNYDFKSGDITGAGSYTFNNLELDTVYYFVVYSYKNNVHNKVRKTAGAIANKQHKSLEIVSFSTGTDAQIAAMLEAHYYDDFDLQTDGGWSVGDTRPIHLNGVNNPQSGGTAWPAQDITIVIVDFDHHDLKTPINGKTKAAITCQTRECVNVGNSNGYATDAGSHGYLSWNLTAGTNKMTSETCHWNACPMATWLNGTYFDAAFSTAMKGMIKEVSRNVLKTRGLADGVNNTGTPNQTTEVSYDKLFIPTNPEIFGAISQYYLCGQSSNAEGTQLRYYAEGGTTARIKYGNNAGNPNSNKAYWWTGSPSTYWSSSYGYYWCSVNTGGSAGGDGALYAYGLAPAFAM